MSADKIDTRVPGEISKAIRKLVKELIAQPQFQIVQVKPESCTIVNECFENVRLKIQKDGGAAQHGWQIWEWPGVFIEAEFHAIWVSPTGEFVDFTQKHDGEQTILFLIDPVRMYQGKSVDNERRALTKDKLILDFIWASKKINQMKIDGEHVDSPNLTTINVREFEYLSTLHKALVLMLKSGAKETSMCFFGSSKRYRSCHSL